MEGTPTKGSQNINKLFLDYQVPELQVLPGEGTHLSHVPLQHSLGAVTRVSDQPCSRGAQPGLLCVSWGDF